jgi:hypothetical protein
MNLWRTGEAPARQAHVTSHRQFQLPINNVQNLPNGIHVRRTTKLISDLEPNLS